MTSQTDLRETWDRLRTTVYRVLDSDGDNPGNSLIRRLEEPCEAVRGDEPWLYVDDVDGYELLTDTEVGFLQLEEVE